MFQNMFQFQFFQAPRKFLLGTFKEVVILWQRLRVEAREARNNGPPE